MLSKNQLKYIQSLGQKKPRDEANLFIAEGPKIVKDLLASPTCNVKQVYALAEWIKNNPAARVGIIEITQQELEKISQLTTAHQVLAVVEKIKWKSEPPIQGTLSLLLETIQDPGNMGTIIRVADWFGIKNVFCSPDCADIYNPKVVQATMGSIARVRIEYCSLPGLLKKHNDIRSYAAVLDGRDITKMEKPGEGFIIIGNESKGISAELLGLANVRITIPGKGNTESLNAAIATGIILSHFV
jgi:TrmH family RNA methyltransferase